MAKFTCLITPGRSGSTLLKTILNTLYGVSAEESYFTTSVSPGNCYTRIFGKDESIKNEFIKRRITYIEKLVCNHYVDTVSLSCQDNIIERYLDNGYKMNVITLRRDPRLVAKSYYELKWDPISYPLSFVSPGGPGLKMTLTSPHQYQNCLWYSFEIERIARDYKIKLNNWGIKHYETNLRQILTMDGFNDIMSYFGMPLLDKPFTERINDLAEYKVLPLDRDLALSLEEEFVANIKSNNDFDDSFFNVDEWYI